MESASCCSNRSSGSPLPLTTDAVRSSRTAAIASVDYVAASAQEEEEESLLDWTRGAQGHHGCDDCRSVVAVVDVEAASDSGSCTAAQRGITDGKRLVVALARLMDNDGTVADDCLIFRCLLLCLLKVRQQCT